MPGPDNETPATVAPRASGHPESSALQATDIQVGHCYSNGEFGPNWQVRRVVGDDGVTSSPSGRDAVVSYRIVAGHSRRREGAAARSAFAQWARYEVYLNENSWQRVSTPCHLAVTGDAA